MENKKFRNDENLKLPPDFMELYMHAIYMASSPYKRACSNLIGKIWKTRTCQVSGCLKSAIFGYHISRTDKTTITTT